MSKPLLLKLHRWTTLVFALPMLAIILTGFILSFEPMIEVSGIAPGSLDPARIIELVKRYDPEGKARGVALDPARQRLTFQGPHATAIDLVTGEQATSGSGLADLFRWARFTHERLLGQSWLVVSSTIAMVVIMSLGILMGLPRLRNSVSGWHKGTAWFTLPLILLSPLTGLCLALGLTFQSAPVPGGAGRPLALSDAIGVVAKSHDLAQVTSIGTRGGRVMARLFEGGELRAFAVNPDGLVELPRNWPRLIHEGNWSAMIAGPLNVITSIALLALLSTGLWLWARRKLRRPLARGERDAERTALKQAA